MAKAQKKDDDATPESISEPPLMLPAPAEEPEVQVIPRMIKSPRMVPGNVPIGLRVSQAQRTLVRDLTVWGVPQTMICKHLIDPNTGEPIGVQTLSHYFRKEINEGLAEANARLGRTAYLMAVGHPAEYDEKGNLIRKEQEPDRKMLIFQMRVRMKYTDRLIIEHQQTSSDELSQHLQDLTPDELWQLRSLLSKPVRGIEDGTPPEGGEDPDGEKS